MFENYLPKTCRPWQQFPLKVWFGKISFDTKMDWRWPVTTSSMFRQTVVLPHECSCVRVCVGFAVGGVATPGAGAATTQLKLQLLPCLLSPVSPVPATVARSVSRSPRPAQSGASCPVTQLSQQTMDRVVWFGIWIFLRNKASHQMSSHLKSWRGPRYKGDWIVFSTREWSAGVAAVVWKAVTRPPAAGQISFVWGHTGLGSC